VQLSFPFDARFHTPAIIGPDEVTEEGSTRAKAIAINNRVAEAAYTYAYRRVIVDNVVWVRISGDVDGVVFVKRVSP